MTGEKFLSSGHKTLHKKDGTGLFRFRLYTFSFILLEKHSLRASISRFGISLNFGLNLNFSLSPAANLSFSARL